VTVAPEIKALHARLRGDKALEQPCEGASLPDFEVCRTLWAYRVVGVIKRLDDADSLTGEDDEGLGVLVSPD